MVTGAAGHLGNIAVRALVAEGVGVRALVHRQRRSLEGVLCEQLTCNVRDATAVQRAIAGATGVIHLAARISLSAHDADDMMAVNVEGTRNVIAACRAEHARLLHVSSIHALDPRPLDRAKATAPFAVGWARLRSSTPLYTSATLGHYAAVDGSHARDTLGWAPRPLEETLADTVAWWRSELVKS